MLPGASAPRGPASSRCHTRRLKMHMTKEKVPKLLVEHILIISTQEEKDQHSVGLQIKRIILYRPRVAMSQNHLRSTAHPLPPQRAKGALASTCPE